MSYSFYLYECAKIRGSKRPINLMTRMADDQFIIFNLIAARRKSFLSPINF
jgi:hypothetical protein